VKRAVWERDQGRCTFVGSGGHRCGARKLLEFDHVDPVARGGQATVERMRLRCRVHNQYEAERTFGAAFMKGKRAAAEQRMAPPEAERPEVERPEAERPEATNSEVEPTPT
jgi:5-methylcytosine-specific restriction endonuclease McrA